jgi:hypothetical protein
MTVSVATVTVEEDVTDDLAALQQLPEHHPAPYALEPTCATTGVGGGPEPGSAPAAPGSASTTHAGSAADRKQGS